MTIKNTFKEHMLRVVAVIGLIAVLLLGAWGIIQLAFFIPTFLSNLAGGNAAKAPTGQTTTTTTPVVQKPVVTAPVKTTTPAKTATTASAGTKYVASGRTTNLYGYPDLQVRMVSNPGAVRVGSQVSLQFVVENVGTNTTPANWFFTASLPYSPAYTYQSPAQQALYPGDKIVYTLGYTAQYAAATTNVNPCGGWSYPCTNPSPIYGGPGTCNAYGPCNIPGYQQNVYGYTYPAQNYGGTQSASITVDPYNLVSELNESNNTTGVSYQVY